MSAFIWNEGYRAEYNVLLFATKMLRLIMLVIMPVFTVNYYLLERTLRFRYDIAWDEALAYEELLVGEDFHTRIWQQKSSLRNLVTLIDTILALISSIG